MGQGAGGPVGHWGSILLGTSRGAADCSPGAQSGLPPVSVKRASTESTLKPFRVCAVGGPFL